METDGPAGGDGPRLLLVETSHRLGWVALARGNRVLGTLPLSEARRHARDLVPHAKALLDGQGWKPRDLQGVVVSRGPGSYTGLRVGLMAAKTLAYAVGCALLPIDTFAAIALQGPVDTEPLEVFADAQKGKVYHQRFRVSGGIRGAETALTVGDFSEWCGLLSSSTWVSGPGLEAIGERLPALARAVPVEDRLPRPESLLALGLDRLGRGEAADSLTAEPLYLRPSNAEENWKHRQPPGGR